jgi:hypothetical protein
MNVLPFRVAYDNGTEKTFDVRAQNMNTGFHKVLTSRARTCPEPPTRELVRIEFPGKIER